MCKDTVLIEPAGYKLHLNCVIVGPVGIEKEMSAWIFEMVPFGPVDIEKVKRKWQLRYSNLKWTINRFRVISKRLSCSSKADDDWLCILWEQTIFVEWSAFLVLLDAITWSDLGQLDCYHGAARVI